MNTSRKTNEAVAAEARNVLIDGSDWKVSAAKKVPEKAIDASIMLERRFLFVLAINFKWLR